MDRREFLKKVGGGVAGAGLGGFVLPCAFPALIRGARRTPPSERIVIGIIGTGGMGGAHLNWFSGFDDVEVAAVCDVDGNHRDRAAAVLKERRPASRCDVYADFRKVLDRKDIDAVSIAAPDHWHALIALHAFRAGKDVYGEKPLSYTLPEGRAMIDVRREEGRVFQLGTQIHAGENYHRVVDIVRSGVLGRIHTVRVWKTGGTPKIAPAPDADPPKHLDWDMWLGPRPVRAFNPNRCHFKFRYFWDYSGGHFADFWCHIADVVFWALDLGAPRSVAARGRLDTQGMGETHAVLDADFRFDGLDLFWTTQIPDVPGAEGRGIGACFEGEKGHLVTDYGTRRLFINGEEVPGGDLPDVARSVPRSSGHQRNFLDCVKNRRLTESHIDYVHNMTAPMHLALIAFWMGRELRWDGELERFVDDREADGMLDQTYRKPWSLSL
jgi:predicted dehydrogenase